MPHDISGIGSGRSQQSRDSQVSSIKSDGDSGKAQSGSHAQGDTVSITDMAGRLRSLEQKLASQPDIDQAHINQVREAIARGEYKVNPDRVADKMMNFEADF